MQINDYVYYLGYACDCEGNMERLINHRRLRCLKCGKKYYETDLKEWLNNSCGVVVSKKIGRFIACL